MHFWYEETDGNIAVDMCLKAALETEALQIWSLIMKRMLWIWSQQVLGLIRGLELPGREKIVRKTKSVNPWMVKQKF